MTNYNDNQPHHTVAIPRASASGRLPDLGATGEIAVAKTSDPPEIAISGYGSRTHVGYVRKHNEDSLLVAPPLFVVCDGMGGHEAGEVASELAVRIIGEHAPNTVDADGLGQAIEEANLAIIDAADAGLGKAGMGTTCTAAILNNDKLAIGQVGDSRAYLLHDTTLQQLTRDHSVVADLVEAGDLSPADARVHQWRSYITRALGLDPLMKADLYEIRVSAGDRLMLCSDGLYSMISDEVIGQIMASVPDPQACADKLVAAALEEGGSDNITVIIVDSAGREMQKRKIVRHAKTTAVLIIAILIALLAAAAVAFGFWADNSAYLAAQDGKVVIYKGVPGEFMGMQFSHLEEATDVELASLQPGVARRIEALDVRCDSVDAARALVQEYKDDIAKGTGSDSAASSGGNAGNSSGADTSGGSDTASTEPTTPVDSGNNMGGHGGTGAGVNASAITNPQGGGLA